MAIVQFGFYHLLFFATIISSTCCAFTITDTNRATATARTTFTTINQSKTSLLLSSSRGHHDDTNSINANILSASTSSKMKLTSTSLTSTSTTRRSTVGTIMSTMMLLFFLLPFSSCPQSAIASYGDSTKIELPNYIEYLIEKNASVDSSKILYKGADMEVQLKRISDASLRLKDIPSIAREKKWSQIQGILTGPLGTLVQTMNALNKGLSSSSSAADEEAAKVASAKVKADLIRISQEATKKDEMGVIKASQQAQDDLEAFARLVF